MAGRSTLTVSITYMLSPDFLANVVHDEFIPGQQARQAARKRIVTVPGFMAAGD